MSDTPVKLDKEKGDEVLKRMLKTPPKPHSDKPEDSPKDDRVKPKRVRNRRDKD